MRQKAPEAGVLVPNAGYDGEREVNVFAGWIGSRQAASKGGVTGVMWRVMTRRNERNWFFQNTRREQGIGAEGLYIKCTESGVAGVLIVESRNGAADTV